ncbi:MAG: hypothetical protein KC478_11980 [Bacteriovoracaceae bacterium]|nr:hypothetical protein [Bacteriovoracaceae bacterium]
MKHLIFALCFLSSVSSFATTIKLDVDVAQAKEAVRKAASTELLYNQKLIKRDLDVSSVVSIVVGKDILSSSKGLSVTAIVLPEEGNCNCQDVFRAEMYAELKDGKLVVPNGAEVEKSYSDH